VLALETELPTDSRYRTNEEQTMFFEHVLERMAAIPGIQSAAIASSLPLDERNQRTGFSIEGRPLPPSGQLLPAGYRSISEAYFSTMGIPLLRGRSFTGHDRTGSPPVAMIDETAAERYWPAGSVDPIGQKVRLGSTVFQIVGVVGAVRNGGLDREPLPTVYTCYHQYPEAHTSIVLRHPNPTSIVNDAKRAIYAVDRQQPVFNVRTMQESIAGSQSAARFALLTLAVFAFTALALAAIGIYGVIAYSVAQRRGEIGIRIALGARTSDVLRLVIGEGLILVGAGVATGLVAAAAASRLLASLLYGISPHDPLIFAGTALALAAVALAATWLPARRAARIDPIVSLRYE
jgi:putative ABC transport system permease protein